MRAFHRRAALRNQRAVTQCRTRSRALGSVGTQSSHCRVLSSTVLRSFLFALLVSRQRDLAAIRAAGFNTLRIYAWSSLASADHEPFLDACHAAGLKVFLTHYVGTAADAPVSTVEQRAATVTAFVQQVAKLGDHPAILAWSFGNELNGPWLGFVEEINQAFSCNWDKATCTNVLDAASPCYTSQGCLYTNLYGWLDSALEAARNVTTRPLTSTFADIDMLVGTEDALNKIPRFNAVMSHFDMYAIQLVRTSAHNARARSHAALQPRTKRGGDSQGVLDCSGSFCVSASLLSFCRCV